MLISDARRLSRYSSAFLLTLREILRHKEPMRFRNREGFVAYDFALRGKTWKKGVSAMLRVKNEEGKILYCLSSILDVFDEIVLVDNGSTDSTLELVKRFKRDRDHRDKISLFSYPFQIVRCGDENRNAPEDSVHTSAYYYNWSLSKCRYSYVFKVDADMVVVPNGARRMRTLFRGLSPFIPTIVNTPVQTTYRSLSGTWLLAKMRFTGNRGCSPTRQRSITARRSPRNDSSAGFPQRTRSGQRSCSTSSRTPLKTSFFTGRTPTLTRTESVRSG